MKKIIIKEYSKLYKINNEGEKYFVLQEHDLGVSALTEEERIARSLKNANKTMMNRQKLIKKTEKLEKFNQIRAEYKKKKELESDKTGLVSEIAIYKYSKYFPSFIDEKGKLHKGGIFDVKLDNIFTKQGLDSLEEYRRTAKKYRKPKVDVRYASKVNDKPKIKKVVTHKQLPWRAAWLKSKEESNMQILRVKWSKNGFNSTEIEKKELELRNSHTRFKSISTKMIIDNKSDYIINVKDKDNIGIDGRYRTIKSITTSIKDRNKLDIMMILLNKQYNKGYKDDRFYSECRTKSDKPIKINMETDLLKAA